MWEKVLKKLSETTSIREDFLSTFAVKNESQDEINLVYSSEDAFKFHTKLKTIEKIKNIATDLFGVSVTFTYDPSEESKKPVQTDLNSLIEEKKKPKEDDTFESTLNKNFTFENFVPGPTNKTAFEAAKLVARTPGHDYNPLLIYGESGLGKTHIIQAIGNYAETTRNDSVFYTDANIFTNMYINSIKTNEIDKLEKSICKNKILLIDDIQFFSGKESTQTFLFNILVSFFNSNKRVVFTSDRYITEINDIHDRLKTRFAMGASLEIKPPEFETRVAIIRKKIELMENISFDDETVNFIASNFKNNVREIEGALTTIKITADLCHETHIDTAFAKPCLKKMITKKVELDVSDIIKITALNMNIKPNDILSASRTKNIVTARHIAAYLSKKYTSSTYKEIGEKMGNRNHSTIICSCEKIDNTIRSDTNIKKLVEKIEREIEEQNNN
ncbi:chromosomal replication initiator protein DnaA [bacterium]|nr:chromosomal replication initiator protein DnaA [bacterium]